MQLLAPFTVVVPVKSSDREKERERERERESEREKDKKEHYRRGERSLSDIKKLPLQANDLY